MDMGIDPIYSHFRIQMRWNIISHLAPTSLKPLKKKKDSKKKKRKKKEKRNIGKFGIVLVFNKSPNHITLRKFITKIITGDKNTIGKCQQYYCYKRKKIVSFFFYGDKLRLMNITFIYVDLFLIFFIIIY